jgi:tyrosinase
LRALVTLQNVEPPSAADFFVRVFVNAPETVSDQTPITDPHYAGSFGFFLMSGAMATGGAMPMGGAGYLVDVTDALRRVGVADSLDVQLVAVPYPNREVRARGFLVGGLELAIAKLGASAKKG